LPAALLSRMTGDNVIFLEAAQRIIAGEPTVRDVCATCNGGPLSVLDNYICGLYDTYFHRIVKPAQTILFKYDFHNLARWLLKVSFNSTRTKNEGDAPILARYREYVLDPSGKRHQLALFLQLVGPRLLTKSEAARIGPRWLTQLPKTPDGRQQIPPFPMRISRATSSQHFAGVVHRLVSINSFYFYILIPRNAPLLPKTWKDVRRSAKARLDQAQQLLEDSNSVSISVSLIDHLSSFKPTTIANPSVFQQWLHQLEGLPHTAGALGDDPQEIAHRGLVSCK